MKLSNCCCLYRPDLETEWSQSGPRARQKLRPRYLHIHADWYSRFIDGQMIRSSAKAVRTGAISGSPRKQQNGVTVEQLA
jgi:hypothetical protein